MASWLSYCWWHFPPEVHDHDAGGGDEEVDQGEALEDAHDPDLGQVQVILPEVAITM